jgi:GFO/IDH/MocA oxidoreductase family protein
MRIGIVGTENSHADHYVRHFNTDGDYPGHRVVALAGGRSERNVTLAEAGGIEHIVDSPEQLVGLVDAGIVCSRDGGQHRAEASALLDAGLTVLVDKPLACSVSDAEAILELAHKRNVPVTSFSALRFSSRTTEWASRLTAEPDTLIITGPADPTSQYAGIFFYGIHVVEIAQALTKGRLWHGIAVQDLEDAVVATAQAGQTRIILEFVKPNTRTETQWRMVASGPAGLIAENLKLDADYARPSIDVFAEMLNSGKAPLTDEELLAPVRALSAIAEAL